MAFKTLSDNLEKSGDKAQEYIKNTTEYYKLRVFKTVTKGAISLINYLIIGFILFMILLFFSVGVALWLGDVIDSRYLGYFIVGGFYILVMILLIIFGKEPLKKAFLLKFSDIFFDNDDDPELDVETRIATNQAKTVEEDEKI